MPASTSWDAATDLQPASRSRGSDLPGAAKVYEPLTALPMETLPETFVHPAGYCQNVLSTGECQVLGQEVVRGRETIGLLSRHPRTTEMEADRPDYAVRIAVDRDTGIIVRSPRRPARGARGTPKSSTWSPTRCSSRRPSTSSSRRGRRCSTDAQSGVSRAAGPGRLRGSRRSTRRCRWRSPGRR